MDVLFPIGTLIFLSWIYYRLRKANKRYIDNNGYERDGFNRLIHRQVAYKQLYNIQKYPKRFREYVVHHIDGDKTNNSPNNLKILTQDYHARIHGF